MKKLTTKKGMETQEIVLIIIILALVLIASSIIISQGKNFLDAFK